MHLSKVVLPRRHPTLIKQAAWFFFHFGYIIYAYGVWPGNLALFSRSTVMSADVVACAL